MSSPDALPREELVSLRIAGPDARSFLQGQLTNDMKRLTRERALLAACNSPRGKLQAVLTLLEHPDAMVALLPASIVRR